MARQFKQPEGGAGVVQTQQNLSLASQPDTLLQDVVGITQQSLAEGRIESLRDEVTGIVDQFDEQAELLLAGGGKDPQKPLTDEEVQAILGENQDVHNLGTQLKALAQTHAKLNRAESQGRIDSGTLAARLEVATRKAIRLYPSIARELAQVAGLYGSSTLVNELRKMESSRGTKSDEQQQLEDLQDEMVAAGANRAMLIAQPGLFYEDGLARLQRQRENNDAKVNYDLKAAGEKSTIADKTRALNGEMSDIAIKVDGVMQGLMQKWPNPETMRQEIAAGHVNWRAASAKLANIRQTAIVELTEKYGEDGILATDIVKAVDSMFGVSADLLAENSPEAFAKQGAAIMQAVDQAHWFGMPEEMRKTIQWYGTLNDNGFLSALQFVEKADQRKIASRMMDFVATALQPGFDSSDPATKAKHDQAIEQNMFSWWDTYQGESSSEQRNMENFLIDSLRLDSGDWTKPEDVPPVAAEAFYVGAMNMLVVTNEGARFPMPTTRKILAAFADPRVVPVLRSRSNSQYNFNGHENSLDQLAEDHAINLAQKIEGDAHGLRRNITGFSSAEGLETSGVKLGEGVFVGYKDGQFYFEDRAGNPIKTTRTDATDALKDLQRVMYARAHLDQNYDYDVVVRRWLEQRPQAFGAWLRPADTE